MEETQEEKKVREIVKEAEEKLGELNNPARQGARGPSPAPGGIRLMGDAYYQRMRNEAEKVYQEKTIRQEVLNKAVEAIKDAPPHIQAKAYKIADIFAHPETAEKNDPSKQKDKRKDMEQAQRSAMRQIDRTDPLDKDPAKDMDAAQASARVQTGTPMKERGNEQKDISESGDFAMRKIGDEKEKNRTVEPSKDEPSAKEANVKESFTATFSGARYYQQLKDVIYTDHSPSPKKDKGPDLDR